MTKKLYEPGEQKMRIVGFASGSGNSLWRVLELQKELDQTFEGSPFEVVGVFSDKPDSVAIQQANQLGLPAFSLNLREFHQAAGTQLSDLETRAAYDSQVYELIKECNADMILLAGYVWATTSILVDNYLVVNVHPADLSVVRDGIRPYAGANGVGSTLASKDNTICSSAHIATSDIDGGPLLMLSPDILLEYPLFDDPDLMKKHYLKLVNEHSRELSARVVLELSEGKYGIGNDGIVKYKGMPVPDGKKLTSWDEDRPNYQRHLEGLIAPKSIAIIGASAKEGLGKSLLRNAISTGYRGQIYVVNKSGQPVEGVEGFQSLSEIEAPIDLAVLAVPSASILQVVEQCGEKGVKAVVCISAGFRETGAVGAEKEKVLQQLLNKYNMRMLGPNCMGILNTDENVCLNATMLQHKPIVGGVGMITQSGALGAAMLDYADTLGYGFSIVASLGNQTDVNVNDLLPALADDPKTKVILLYLEAIPEPMRFLRIARKITKNKPIILVKAGRSEAGAVAASSHTGSIAGSDQVIGALLAKAGVIRVETLEQGYLGASTFSKMPPMKGNRIGVITNAGGPGILAVDSMSAKGFELPVLPNIAREILASQLFAEAATGNPIDVVAAAPPEHYAVAIKAMIASGQYDAITVVCVPPATIDTGAVAEAIALACKDSNLPVLCNFIGPTLGQPARLVLKENRIPHVDYPEKLAEILCLLQEWGKHQPEMELPTKNAVRIHGAQHYFENIASGEYLTSMQAFGLLEYYGFIAPPYSMSGQINPTTFPVVAKIEHRDVIHKSDEGGVILNISDQKSLDQATEALLQKFPGAEGVFIQEQFKLGMEIFMGGKREGEEGPVVLIGAGGTAVEIYNDVCISHSPLDQSIALNAIKSLKCYPLLEGYRGKPGVNLQKLAEAAKRLGQMLYELPEIKEIDLNPIVYLPDRDVFAVLDCRIRV